MGNTCKPMAVSFQCMIKFTTNKKNKNKTKPKKKPECWRINAFELWWWKRLLRVPWAARKSNQSILKEINSKYSLEALMLKRQYFGHPMWRADSSEKTLMPGKMKSGEGNDRGWDGWMASLTQWTWVWAKSGRWWTGKPGLLQSMRLQRAEHDWVAKQQLLKGISKGYLNFHIHYSSIHSNQCIEIT